MEAAISQILLYVDGGNKGWYDPEGKIVNAFPGPLDGDTRQTRGRFMKSLHGEVYARCDRATLKGAVGGDDVEGRRRAGVDDQERARIGDVRADGVHQTIGAGLGWLLNAHRNAQIDVLADDHGLHMKVAPREIA